METENDAGVEGVFQYLAREMANVSSALTLHCLTTSVVRYKNRFSYANITNTSHDE